MKFIRIRDIPIRGKGKVITVIHKRENKNYSEGSQDY